MSKFGSNPFVQLRELMSPGATEVATVSAVHSDGTVTVTKRGGGSVRARAQGSYPSGENVLLQDGTVLGKAPTMGGAVINV